MPSTGGVVEHLRPCQYLHDFLVRHLFEQLGLVEGTDHPEGEHRGEEVAELAADHAVVVVHARLRISQRQ